jgi:hypothetical protein
MTFRETTNEPPVKQDRHVTRSENVHGGCRLAAAAAAAVAVPWIVPRDIHPSAGSDEDRQRRADSGREGVLTTGEDLARLRSGN